MFCLKKCHIVLLEFYLTLQKALCHVFVLIWLVFFVADCHLVEDRKHPESLPPESPVIGHDTSVREDGSIVFGEETLVYRLTCPKNEFGADYFPSRSLQGPAMPLVPYDYFVPRIIPVLRDSWFAAGSCKPEYQEGIQEFCISHFDGKKWSRIEAPHRLPLQSIVVTRDETVWLVTGIDATAYRTLGLEEIEGCCLPRPVGELRRWGSDRCWQRLRLPDSPVTLAGWKYLRFVPIEVVVQEPVDVRVSGYWYFVRKPSPRRLEVKKVGGLLHLENKVTWSDCDY